jgi:hypothetical protein
MMTQEEYMNVKALHAGGWTIKQSEVSREFGTHQGTRTRCSGQSMDPPSSVVHTAQDVVVGPVRFSDLDPRLPVRDPATWAGTT